MNQQLIETYVHTGEGYNPFLIGNDWQVAQLNYVPSQDPEKIEKVELHRHTDEVFILTKGKAVLIAGALRESDFELIQCIHMVKGVTYNIPAMVWHNIAMEKETEVIIIERSNTHLDDVVVHPLTSKDIQTLKVEIRSALLRH